jgi:protein-S-isoprenylcysteine O-methyltransferase Ste14
MPRFLMPPVWLLLSVIAMLMLRRYAPGAESLGYPWTLLGLAPLIAGIILGAASAAAFRRHKTTIIPFHDSAALLTAGPFRLSRNPIYLGMILSLIGAAMLTGAATSFLVVIAFALVIHFGFVLREEAMLEARFGESFRDYAAQVRRWI